MRPSYREAAFQSWKLGNLDDFSGWVNEIRYHPATTMAAVYETDHILYKIGAAKEDRSIFYQCQAKHTLRELKDFTKHNFAEYMHGKTDWRLANLKKALWWYEKQILGGLTERARVVLEHGWVAEREKAAEFDDAMKGLKQEELFLKKLVEKCEDEFSLRDGYGYLVGWLYGMPQVDSEAEEMEVEMAMQS
jgi:hypothetical protein